MRIRNWLLIAFVCTVSSVFAGRWWGTQTFSFSSTKMNFQPSDVWIVDDQNYPLESIRRSETYRSLEWVKMADVSPAFQEILIRAEDKRFYLHHGVDPLALGRAFLEKVTGRSDRGASTLTMQLVGLLRKEKTGRRSFFNKVSQIFRALRLETSWTKEQILESYLNLVSFRGELVGLRAASLGYFGKHPEGLDREEAALLVSLLRAPNASYERVADRACQLLKTSNDDGETCARLRTLSHEKFSEDYRLARSREVVPVLSDHFTKESTDKSIIATTLDHRVQTLAMSLLREQLGILKNQNVNDGAVLVVDTQTGRVLAYVANGGAQLTSASQVDGIEARRQAGSTIKPFVYGTAYDLNLLEPNSLLEDSPADISVSLGRVYHPKNYDQIFRGFVSSGEALASSLNVPAVRALRLVGEAHVLDRMRALGFNHLYDDDYYGPSLALGSVDVSLWELTHAYRNFALADSVFSESTRASIFHILSSPEYRRFTFGMSSLLTLPFRAAVKTGTSKDMRDNWCIGWTPRYTVGVWVGNFSGQPMWNVSGISGAAPIWRSLMLALHPVGDSDSPDPSLISQSYSPPSKQLTHRTISRIRYPASQMLVGIDPDIPKRLQKLPIEIENPQKNHRIFMNDKLLGRSQDTILWPIRRGKYQVKLKTSDGHTVDEVKFEVR